MPSVRTFTKGGRTATATSDAQAALLLGGGWVEGPSTPYDTTTPTADLQAQIDNETAWRTLIDSGLDTRLKVDRVGLGAGLVGGAIRRVNVGATATSPFGLEWSAMSFVGLPRSVYAAGYVDCYMPPSGTLVHGHGGAPDRTTGSVQPLGVLLAPWETLYYAPPAAGGGTVDANWHVVGYTADFDIPTTWLALAQRSGMGAGTSGSAYYDEVRWADGYRATPWVSTGLLGTWANYGATYADYGIRRVNGIVYLKGLVKGGAVGTNIAALPYGFLINTVVANQQRIFHCPGTAPQRVDVFANGAVQYVGAGVAGQPADSSFLDLSAISYPAEG